MTYVLIHRWWTNNDEGPGSIWSINMGYQNSENSHRDAMAHAASRQERVFWERINHIDTILLHWADRWWIISVPIAHSPMNKIWFGSMYMVFVTQSINVPSYLPFDDAMAGSYSCIQCKNRCRLAIYCRQFRSYFPFFYNRHDQESRYNN